VDAKKKTLYAREQDPEARAAWQAHVATLDPRTFVFLDETSTTPNMTRRYARAPVAVRAVDRAPRNYKQRTTLVAALSPEGIGAAMTLPGAIDANAFAAYVEHCLCPTLQPGQVVIFDNLSSHLGASVRALLEAAQCTVLPLPSYSPDFSPIELAFSKLKEQLRTVAARTQDALEQAIAEALDMISASEACAWFKHCGYPVLSPT
jgi:transposase